MQKFLKILESNVQWIALGFGVLYLLWTVYGYVINSPVAVTIDKTVLGPDNAVQYIQEQKGVKLNSALNDSRTVDIPTTDVLAPYLAKLGEEKANTKDVFANMGGTRGELNFGPVGNQGQALANAQVQKLPELPPAQFVNASSGVTTILAGPGGAPANAAAQPVGLVHEDHNWDSLRFKIPLSAFKGPWETAFGQSDFAQRNTARFLQIELLRQEKSGDKWSEPVKVAQLPVASLPDYPGDVIPTQNREVGFQYKDSAGKSTEAILNPKFPDPVPGAPGWIPPGQNGPVVPPPKAAGGVGAVRPPGGAAVPAPAAGGGALQNGDFDPTAPNVSDREVIVHDLTPQDGKTYRYAIRYRLTNPYWDASGGNIATPDITQQFAIISPPSEWSKEITIDSRTKIFATNADAKRQRATFDLLEWKDTKWHSTKLEVAPGDSIKDWTIVDIRPEKDPVVLVLDTEGNIIPHSRGRDTNADYQSLKALAAPAPAAAPAGPATPAPRQMGLNNK